MTAPAGVRLSTPEVAAIKRIVAAHFGATAEVRVFGSRTQPDTLGGDLDLMVAIDGPKPDLGVEGAIVWAIEDALDGLPVDLVVIQRGDALGAFEQRAWHDGVAL